MCFELPSWQPPSTSGNIIAKPSKHDRKVKKAVDSLKAEKEVQEAVKGLSKPKGFTKKDRYKIVSIGICEYCGIRKGEKRADGTIARMEADHRISRHDGGDSTLENGACSCEQCNNGKRARSAKKKPLDPPPPKSALTPEAIKWLEEKAGEKKLIEIAELGARQKKGEVSK